MDGLRDVKPEERVKGYLKKLGKNLKEKAKRKLEELTEGIPEDANAWQVTGRVAGRISHSVKEKTKKAYQDTKDQYKPATDEEKKCAGIEALIGSKLPIYVGKTETVKCKMFLDEVVKITIDAVIKAEVMEDVSGYAINSMDQLKRFYRTTKLKEHPLRAKAIVDEFTRYEQKKEKKKKQDQLIYTIQKSNWIGDDLKEEVVKACKDNDFSESDELIGYFVRSDVTHENLMQLGRYKKEQQLFDEIMSSDEINDDYKRIIIKTCEEKGLCSFDDIIGYFKTQDTEKDLLVQLGKHKTEYGDQK
ncbi:hypothetical protein COV93_02005 [Candidatus Woesearchaeota archaeon CG11_big_fil_rev_8_21_14_0_20_43_8]|nr:MAG: hypothetical protein COV93_02005 [Candidatus Woesearchaeota archaeon CG11_big_fil_rev_8_21_14_0_20_43_8]PIO07050.1 MAG: hypothetical protein COT47_01695 [Candidatus Woesearchaeota archaeon CG08_land_8_20_14_0_20_43_7]